MTTELIVNSISNASGYIPIKMISETAPYQFWVALLISGFMIVILGYSFAKNGYGIFLVNFYLKRFSRLTGRPTMLITHSSEGFFSIDMITRKLIPIINSALIKFKNKRFNLILQTPGGDVFATILLSKILRNYSNKIDVYIPNYAMSGGSLLTLSGDVFHFNDYSCIGPIDPQIGTFLSYGSAASWAEVIRKKGAKAKDESIIMHRLGKQVETSIKNYIFDLIKNKCKKPKEFTNFITKGSVEHIYQIDNKVLNKYGFKTLEINDYEKLLLDKILKYKIEKEIVISS